MACDPPAAMPRHAMPRCLCALLPGGRLYLHHLALNWQSVVGLATQGRPGKQLAGVQGRRKDMPPASPEV